MAEPNRLLTAGQVNRAAKQDNRLLRLSPEEEFLQSLSPVDAHRFAIEAQNAKKYTPEQAKNNLIQTGMDALYVTPVVGNVLSGIDAYHYGSAAGSEAAAGNTGEARKNALLGELSALGAITGLPFGNAATRAAKGAAGRTNIFAGSMAKTADHEALANAQRLDQAGVSRDKIWADTGWFKGGDGKWRFEIDDSGASLSGVKPPQSPNHAATFDDLSHPEYEAAYGNFSPDEAPFPSYLPRETGGVFASQLPESGQYFPISQSVFAQGPTEQVARSVGLHEWQHHTQHTEGFTSGTNPFAIMSELDEIGSPQYRQLYEDVFVNLKYGSGDDPRFLAALAKLDEMKHKEMLDLYRRSAGEVEARNVQSRMNMTPAERRATAPWLTQDIPDDQQIVRFR